MDLKKLLINELQMESANTEKMFSRLPEDKFGWKPHEKSYTLQQLATHIAYNFGWIASVVSTDELDLANTPVPPEIHTVAELTALLKQMTADSVKALGSMTDADFDKQWTLRSGETVYFQLNKYIVIRMMSMNHICHHRGQLSVYLRLLNVPVPGMYGPSADEMM